MKRGEKKCAALPPPATSLAIASARKREPLESPGFPRHLARRRSPRRPWSCCRPVTPLWTSRLSVPPICPPSWGPGRLVPARVASPEATAGPRRRTGCGECPPASPYVLLSPWPVASPQCSPCCSPLPIFLPSSRLRASLWRAALLSRPSPPARFWRHPPPTAAPRPSSPSSLSWPNSGPESSPSSCSLAPLPPNPTPRLGPTLWRWSADYDTAVKCFEQARPSRESVEEEDRSAL